MEFEASKTERFMAIILFPRQWYMDAVVADNGLPRERVSIRLSDSEDHRCEYSDQDGALHRNRPRPPSHGHRGHQG